jgi:hypothetical protein
LEATAPAIHQHYSDEVALAVRSALTDAELFISYNMPAKALGPLLGALPMAPNDLRVNQRLAALHTRAGRFAEAAVCCRTLQALYSEAEYPDEATRYGELAERYEERSSAPVPAVSDEGAPIVLDAPSPEAQSEASIPEFSVGEVSAEDESAELSEPASESETEVAPSASPWPMAPEPAEDMTVTPEVEVEAVEESPADLAEEAAGSNEIDLSSEWDDAVTVAGETPAAESELPEVATEEAVAEEVSGVGHTDTDKTGETIEEIRFYIAHGMPEQAMATLARLQTLTRDKAKLAAIRAEVDAAVEAASQQRAAESAAEQPAEEMSVEELTADDIPSAGTTEVSAGEAAVEEASDTQTPVVAEQVAAQQEEERASAEPEVASAQPRGKHGVLSEFVSDLESALGDTFLPGTVAKPAPPAAARSSATGLGEKKSVPPMPIAEVHAEGGAPVLGEFVADIEASLGEDFLKAAPVPEAPLTTAASARPTTASAPSKGKPAPPPVIESPKIEVPLAASAAASATTASHVASSPQPRASVAWATPKIETPIAPAVPVAASPAPAPAASKESPFGDDAGVDLAEMFGELKQDLEAGVAASEEDPETHYNLGIAFREMGLLDEAIGELQKASQSFDRGRPFPQIMQTYTWLAQCFLEKNVPEAAVRWYEKALSIPTIDGETRVALNYELASAYESAGDKSSALKHFMDVYGNNIDYRDVSERIKALKS